MKAKILFNLRYSCAKQGILHDCLHFPDSSAETENWHTNKTGQEEKVTTVDILRAAVACWKEQVRSYVYTREQAVNTFPSVPFSNNLNILW